MNFEKIETIRPFLLIAAILGFLVINCPFLYFVLIEKEVYSEAMSNGIAFSVYGGSISSVVLLCFDYRKVRMEEAGLDLFFSYVSPGKFSVQCSTTDLPDV